MKDLFEFSSFFENTAVKADSGEELTYGQLQTASDEVRAYLHAYSLAFCLCTNTVGSIVGYVALVQQGVATVLLDAYKDATLLDNLMSIYRPNYIWAPAGGSFGDKIYENHGYILYRNSYEQIKIHPELALLLTTSGSTGSPKLVRLTQKNLRCNAESIAEYLQISQKERPITSLPMYYSYGMSVINSHFIMGATLLLTDKTVFDKDFWTFVKEERATSIAGVPYTYEMLKRLRFFRMDLPYLKTMIQAGGKLNADIVKEYLEYAQSNDKKFIVMYGQTEAAPRMSYLPFDLAKDKFASIGVAIPGGKFLIRDMNDNDVETPDTDGELVYMGDNVCMGYAESPDDLSKGDENHGVLHTGDVARRDKDGFYYITGRMKRFVKIWGNRVNLDAIEQMIKPVADDCACVGVDDKLFVFVTNEEIVQELKSYLTKKTGLNIQAFCVKSVQEIPKKVSGKIDYALLSSIVS